MLGKACDWGSARSVRVLATVRHGVAIGALAVAAYACGAMWSPAASLARAGGARAVAARTISLNEHGRLRLTSKHGFVLNEQGTASGTITGTIYIHLDIASNSKVTAEVNIYPRGSSLSGSGSAQYHVVGGEALFGGALAITRGSGAYANARASRLVFTGVIQRRNDAVSVHLSGPLSL